MRVYGLVVYEYFISPRVMPDVFSVNLSIVPGSTVWNNTLTASLIGRPLDFLLTILQGEVLSARVNNTSGIAQLWESITKTFVIPTELDFEILTHFLKTHTHLIGVKS